MSALKEVKSVLNGLADAADLALAIMDGEVDQPRGDKRMYVYVDDNKIIRGVRHSSVPSLAVNARKNGGTNDDPLTETNLAKAVAYINHNLLDALFESQIATSDLAQYFAIRDEAECNLSKFLAWVKEAPKQEEKAVELKARSPRLS